MTAEADRRLIARALRLRANGVVMLRVAIDDIPGIRGVLGRGAAEGAVSAAERRIASALTPSGVVESCDDGLAIAMASEDSPRVLAERIHRALMAPFVVGGRVRHLRCSVGAAAVCDASDDNAMMAALEQAGAAVFLAQRAGGDRIEEFSHADRAEALQRLDLEEQLRRALEDDQLAVFFQPVVRATDRQVGGYEALVRWRHPERGLVPPEDFIPIAEECGLIGRVDHWVLDCACGIAAGWKEPLHVTVNVSGRDLGRGTVADNVVRALRASGLPAERLWLEVTESAMLEGDGATCAELRRIRALGVRVALDDFGTGYSSLSALAELPVDCVKIDRSFVRRLQGGRREEAMLAAILGLAHALELPIVAEGVEDGRQANWLSDHGVPYLQGYLFGAPDPTPAHER